jgi:hypothetical protein
MRERGGLRSRANSIRRKDREEHREHHNFFYLCVSAVSWLRAFGTLRKQAPVRNVAP